jgi:hypothetical protein
MMNFFIMLGAIFIAPSLNSKNAKVNDQFHSYYLADEHEDRDGDHYEEDHRDEDRHHHEDEDEDYHHHHRHDEDEDYGW